MKPTLTDQDWQAAATLLGCSVAAIRAVAAVESLNSGFNPDGTPVTLFEGHKFYAYTKGAYATTYPTICYPHWTAQFYGHTWVAEQARLRLAVSLNRTAALLSASWGRFQIMGFNFALVGYTNVSDFVVAMSDSEQKQLQAFCAYVQHTGLNTKLAALDWAGFARGYNGADFVKNDYDHKLAKAYDNFA